jgi:hypothetical protein
MKSQKRMTPSYLALMQGLSVDPIPQRQRQAGRYYQHFKPREVQQLRKVKSKLNWRWGEKGKSNWE